MLVLDIIMPKITLVVDEGTVYSVSIVVLTFVSFVILKVFAIYSFHPSATLRAIISSIVALLFQEEALAI